MYSLSDIENTYCLYFNELGFSIWTHSHDVKCELDSTKTSFSITLPAFKYSWLQCNFKLGTHCILSALNFLHPNDMFNLRSLKFCL